MRGSWRLRARAGWIAVLVAGCSGGEVHGATATACADVVRIHLGLPDPVDIQGRPVETSESEVRIAYRSIGGGNLPVEGSASCAFAVGGGGALELLSASVDGEPLEASEIEAIRGDL